MLEKQLQPIALLLINCKYEHVRTVFDKFLIFFQKTPKIIWLRIKNSLSLHPLNEKQRFQNLIEIGKRSLKDLSTEYRQVVQILG